MPSRRGVKLLGDRSRSRCDGSVPEPAAAAGAARPVVDVTSTEHRGVDAEALAPSGIGRETRSMMLDHHRRTENLPIPRSAMTLGYFRSRRDAETDSPRGRRRERADPRRQTPPE